MKNNLKARLRKMTEIDLEFVLSWRNSEWIRANMYTDHIISLDEHTAWFTRIKNDPHTHALICEKNETPIGVVNFVQIDKRNKKAFWGFYLGIENGPPGRGLIMEYLALEYAFDCLALRKLCCEVFSFNHTVIKLHKKFGFQEEGIFQRHVQKNNQYEDIVALALFKDEWLLKRDHMKKICFRDRG
ncbi:MAG: UDP-4-amino-4,6-dideoxy-N-acetyl-beta-L-altrosamine N-acetyltransferase [Desulfobulbaceae bacterium]|nr:UDP-4-amino-4,6-dideoxy-N-acetyl-beta-L-altrosamine N-acetyltransferase [Desulfobulbaceae bacterium]